MVIVDRLKAGWAQLTAPRHLAAPMPVPAKGKKQGRLNPTKTRSFAAKVDLDAWKRAISQAEDPRRPRRQQLLALYKEFMRDGHLRSQVAKLKNKVLAEPFVLVNDAGTEQPDALKLFNRPWFYSLLSIAQDSEYFGHSLLNFDYPNAEGEFERFDLIPRELVVPEQGIVLLDPAQDGGIPFRDVADEYARLLIEIGKPDDLGLLQHVGPDIIWKRYSRSDWARLSERYGIPIAHLQTDEQDDTTLDEMQRALANLGSSGHMITGKDDALNLVESKGSGFDIFREQIELSNDEISKLLTGQTMTSDSQGGAVKGEVHERTEEHFVQAKMRFLYFFVNYKLLPFLAGWGYKVDGLTWKWRRWIDEEQQRAAGTDNTTDPAPAPGEDKPQPAPKPAPKPTGKKLNAPAPKLPTDPCCGVELAAGDTPAPPDPELTKRVLALMKRMHQESEDALTDWLTTPEWQDVQAHVAAQLYDGVEAGFDKNLTRLDPDTADAVLLTQLRENTFVFSAYRNYQLLRQLNELLPDPNDVANVRPWSSFRQEALKLHDEYNGEWLRTEYDTAVTTAQGAAKWLRYQEDAEYYYLKVSTVRDERVRFDHKLLEGITLPVDDPFWQTHWIPFGWNCRCNIVRVPRDGREATDLTGRDLPSIPKMFRNNAGQNGVIFPDSHRYFDVAGDEVKDAIKRAAGVPGK